MIHSLVIFLASLALCQSQIVIPTDNCYWYSGGWGEEIFCAPNQVTLQDTILKETRPKTKQKTSQIAIGTCGSGGALDCNGFSHEVRLPCTKRADLNRVSPAPVLRDAFLSLRQLRPVPLFVRGRTHQLRGEGGHQPDRRRRNLRGGEVRGLRWRLPRGEKLFK